MSPTVAIFRRELGSYFATPLAYVFIVIFLVMSGALTFYLGHLYERGQADLAPFFQNSPMVVPVHGTCHRHAFVGRGT